MVKEGEIKDGLYNNKVLTQKLTNQEARIFTLPN
jgi:hypothetical protein